MSTTSKKPATAGDPDGFDKLLDRFIPARRQRRDLLRQNEKLESFLRAVPVEYCGWDQEGTQAVSAGFAALFGIDKPDSLDDILPALSKEDGKRLQDSFETLQKNNQNFELNALTGTTEKSLKIKGKSGHLPGQAQVFHVIWAFDVSDLAHTAEQNFNAVVKLEKKENELRSALNALPFPIWTRGKTLDITWCNKAYTRAAQETTATIIAEQRELPLTGSGKQNMDQRLLAQQALGRDAAQKTDGHLIIDGERRRVEIMEIPLIKEQYVVGMARDITREEELEAAYDRLAASQREALEQLRTAIAMFDKNTRLEFYNSAYEDLTGLSGTWLDTKPRITDIIDKMRENRKLPEQADYKQFKQSWLAHFTSLIDPHEEMQYLPDGTVLRMIAVPRPAGGLLLTLEDVTSRVELETSYNTLMAVQQETIDNLAEGIAVFGEDGKLRLVNNAYAKIWGLSDSLLKQMPHISALVTETKPFFDSGMWPTAEDILLSSALKRAPRKDRLKRKDGMVLEYSVMPLPDGNILSAWFDVTDTVQVENALIEKNAALQEAERLKSDFLANVSYQLRTPLNAMMGFAEMLDQQYFGPLNNRQLEYTKGITDAGRRLVSLINDILDLSTIEAGYLTLSLAQISLQDLATQVISLTQEWARSQDIRLVLEPTEISFMIKADERRIKQVLLNLISNAINYSHKGGTIHIALSKTKDTASLSVRDTGIGITKEDIDRVFTPFERIHDTGTQRRGGAGLGLSLVKSIVELHEGQVEIDSQKDKGTTVTVHLPINGPAQTESF